MVQFRSKNELSAFLRKGLEIERGFESMVQWEGYVQAKSDVFRSTLFTMISESEYHATLVESMLSRLGAAPTDQYNLRHQVFDFSMREEQEVMREIAKSEKLALDTYMNILNSIPREETNWLNEEDKLFMIDSLKRLVEDETRHCELASSCIGKIERIR
jgi:hypothetical protein